MAKKLGNYEAKNDGQKEALAFAIDYANNFDKAFETGQCVVFCGKPGTGKTHLAVGIALNVMHYQGRTAVFTTVQRVMRRIKGTWSRSSEESENEAMSVYQDADLLILDEVGVQYGSDTEKQILFDLFNDRYERRLPTIFISNLQLKDQVIGGKTVLGLQSYLGERVYDRIKEDGGKVVPFTWASYRGQ
jgi:DNA replication protein DnaC